MGIPAYRHGSFRFEEMLGAWGSGVGLEARQAVPAGVPSSVALSLRPAESHPGQSSSCIRRRVDAVAATSLAHPVLPGAAVERWNITLNVFFGCMDTHFFEIIFYASTSGGYPGRAPRVRRAVKDGSR